MFIPLLSPPASAWLISNSPIVLISPKSIVNVWGAGPTAHHLVLTFPSKAYWGASFSFTKLDAVADLLSDKFTKPSFAAFVTVISSVLVSTFSPEEFLAVSVTG